LAKEEALDGLDALFVRRGSHFISQLSIRTDNNKSRRQHNNNNNTQARTMNPVGYRMEEKKEEDPFAVFGGGGVGDSAAAASRSFDAKSQGSYRSTQSSRSSVLERAREYNRRIEEDHRRRAKSLERAPSETEGSSSSRAGSYAGARSKSANRAMTRERAMETVRKDTTTTPTQQQQRPQQRSHSQPQRGSHSRITMTPVSTYSSSAATSKQQQRSVPQTTPQTAASSGSNNYNRTPHHHRSAAAAPRHATAAQQHQQQQRPSPSRSFKSGSSRRESHQQQPRDPQQQQQEGVVTPELLVDALSGHEDGLLAIAEKLMEHYDAGYDVMGEAIIDAFADVQKLFQHVVEAAHMEGAAFEANRRAEEEEMALLSRNHSGMDPAVLASPDPVGANESPVPQQHTPGTPASGPVRHDEFIDQDVKDVLTEAIRKGTVLRQENKLEECCKVYEHACQDASSLLPVDSDHRGRLQLSIARAESMSPDRATAILRYAMDDVLRSGLRAGRTPLPDPSQRADVVLNRPKGYPSQSGVTGQAGVVQSSDEALAAVKEELKEVLSAPIYNDTPLQDTARRFWAALAESQKAQHKNEERLEQNLGRLKGEFLLARAVRKSEACLIESLVGF
jgi:hypothetical protein